MNPIEKQAHLAIKYCADLIVFVFDTSDQAYSKDKQNQLLKRLKATGKDTLIYLSKTDIATSLEKPLLKASITSPASLKKRISALIGHS